MSLENVFFAQVSRGPLGTAGGCRVWVGPKERQRPRESGGAHKGAPFCTERLQAPLRTAASFSAGPQPLSSTALPMTHTFPGDSSPHPRGTGERLSLPALLQTHCVVGPMLELGHHSPLWLRGTSASTPGSSTLLDSCHVRDLCGHWKFRG